MPVLRLFGVNIDVNADGSDEKGSSGDNNNDCCSTISDEVKVYNPVPLRCFPPNFTINVRSGGNLDDDDRDLVDTPLRSNSDSSSRSSIVDDQENQRKSGKRKSNDQDVGEGKKKKRRRLQGREEDLGPEPPSVEEIFPGLVQRIRESANNDGTSPELLYRKVLQDSDMVKQQNRLLICQQGQRKFSSFFTPDEAAAVDGTKEGADVVAILPRRQVSYSLRLKRWNNKKIMVLNSGWSKLVKECNAEMEDVVQIWGFRENGKLGLAINFVNNNHKSPSSNGEGTSKVG